MKSSAAEPEIITRKGKPVSVILPIKAYEALLDRLENAEDAAYMRKAGRKALSFRPLEDVLADLEREDKTPS